MALLWVKYMEKGSSALLDAYYASVKVLAPFRNQGIHLISPAFSCVKNVWCCTSLLINGKALITEETAVKLTKVLGSSEKILVKSRG